MSAGRGLRMACSIRLAAAASQTSPPPLRRRPNTTRTHMLRMPTNCPGEVGLGISGISPLQGRESALLVKREEQIKVELPGCGTDCTGDTIRRRTRPSQKDKRSHRSPSQLSSQRWN
ncbi:hypothetical protein MSAN_00145600 [Mycena sanguinolenta]|uniref:Uncharacterized protein n=1 Tax=Mycena sanguinolenta TaxID=230812 RepID=A0A8H6ZDX8_9AGAR|nr:hypothetical protein MSAN_00145600 [Mycena sanguinolenta]